MCGRICQQRNDLEHFDKASWPSMGHDERQRCRSFPTDMYKVNMESVNRDAKLRQLVQRCLFASPVIAMTPILNQGAHVREIRAILPARIFKLIRPTCGFEATR